ncbi:hypothetical protein D779_3490 [Imhoffiella purpurea]|uniref:Na+/H+ antiporter MnhB subunit-related protein domain-containing protein n=1 Tax=Imhoffiella purpurea TaxID=1249627 RepID=W9VTL5_9GAMM|nr:hypothetical protein D779_3490 [Imhoffiella purpurea]
MALLVAPLALVLLWAFHEALTQPSGARLADLAETSLSRTGVGNPVTAVLLSYRGYDTMLELGVLLAALLGIWSLGRVSPGFHPPELALTAMVAWVVPLLILTAGYLLWAGAERPGGAFQGGALLGAAGVILRLTGERRLGLPSERAQRRLAIAGIGAFLAVGLGTAAAGLGFLAYPESWSKWLILLIETATTLAVGMTLAAAYPGGPPGPAGNERDAP